MEEIRIYQENSDDVLFNSLAKEYRPMILGIIKPMNKYCGDYKIDFDDLYQEALIALYRAMKQFSGETQEHFRKYAYVTIKRHLWRKVIYYRQIYASEMVSLDKDILLDNSVILFANAKSTSNPQRVLYLKELENTYMKIYNSLSLKQKQIIKLRVQDYSYASIAKELNITIKNVDYEIRKVRKIIKQVR